MRLDELINQYLDMFNENFPISIMLGTSEEELIKIIEECIETKMPYKVNYDKECDY